MLKSTTQCKIIYLYLIIFVGLLFIINNQQLMAMNNDNNNNEIRNEIREINNRILELALEKKQLSNQMSLNPISSFANLELNIRNRAIYLELNNLYDRLRIIGQQPINPNQPNNPLNR
ncbi:MAG: putative secreted protein, SAP66-like [Candidatus Phytoplasma pruni]|uniref:SVM family protein n=1 Tax=Poinsettia branch-inducing phytoplasma TaxID=138647 RepID=UPI000370E682|nr:SVM family protein [Poinsettia branch-inducing phytoplasma]WEK82126.1 MAG: putative secreted protein, SAP66-like [Candidatus Phytoplasma pruni]